MMRKYVYTQSLNIFHVGQVAALKGHLCKAKVLIKIAKCMWGFVQADFDPWWYNYLEATLVYLASDVHKLRHYVGCCGSNDAVIERLLRGLIRCGFPDYYRDYRCDDAKEFLQTSSQSQSLSLAPSKATAHLDYIRKKSNLRRW